MRYDELRNLIVWVIALTGLAFSSTCFLWGQQRRVYLANDEHTDYLWTADEEGYRTAWLKMVDYYLDQADRTDTAFTDFQGRFNLDGHYWLWTYERWRSPTEFQRLIGRIKDGHITVPLQPLVLAYGGMSAEAVLRSMYYAGRIERRHDLRFELVSAMENQTLPYGVVSLWAGSGAKYSWKGVCGCATKVPSLNSRGRELYRAVGPDGRSLLMKWHSLTGFYASGGYAEARDPASAVSFATSNSSFLSRYPDIPIVGLFGKGGDDLETLTDEFLTAARTLSTPSVRVIVSNELDFFHDVEESVGPSTLPVFAGGFGNEWDNLSTTMGEVTASVKRNIERLRTAECMATLVSLVDPVFMMSRASSADSAFNAMGLYYEHDWTADGPASGGRAGYQRRLASQISRYVASLYDDARSRLASLVKCPAGVQRLYVLNPLGWQRTDYADIPGNPSLPFRVIDVSTGSEARAQQIHTYEGDFVRILAEHVPSCGYKVFEIQSGTSAYRDTAASAAGGVLENSNYRVTVNARGAIASLLDKRDGNRELVRSINGLAMNDIGSGSGSVTVADAGPVSVSLNVIAAGTPSHRSRITLYHGIDRVDIDDEVTSNFGNSIVSWAFGFNVDGGTVRHEEVGGIATARLLSQGGHYSDIAGRYDYLTMNHFVDISDATHGITLSNWDSNFFRLGNSSVNVLDGATPQVRAVVGGKIDEGLGISNQAGDSYFHNRYALWSHGAYDQAECMRMALEHQNPFVTAYLNGGPGLLPDAAYSLASVSDSSVVIWWVKPSEEGIHEGIIVRLWNLTDISRTPILSLCAGRIASSWRTTHLETNETSLGANGSSIADVLPPQWLQTYRLVIDGMIPFGIVSFSADRGDGGSVIVRWTTASETNTEAFSVERRNGEDSAFAEITGGYVTARGTSGSYLVTDSTADTGHHVYRLKQINKDGSFGYGPEAGVDIPAGITAGSPVPHFALHQNYPNPFNGQTRIQFELPTKMTVKLTLVNMLGQEVRCLTDGTYQAGVHTLECDASGLASGIYFCHMVAGVFVNVKPLMIIR